LPVEELSDPELFLICLPYLPREVHCLLHYALHLSSVVFPDFESSKSKVLLLLLIIRLTWEAIFKIKDLIWNACSLLLLLSVSDLVPLACSTQQCLLQHGLGYQTTSTTTSTTTTRLVLDVALAILIVACSLWY
jgi:hypothetical protein